MAIKPTTVTTGEVRISYEHLLRPYAIKADQDEKYSATLLIPKSDHATKQRIDAAIAAATQDGVSSKWKGACPPALSVPIHDGDTVRDNGEPYGEECRGHWVMNVSSKQKQEIVDTNMNPIIDSTEVYSGMYARVCVSFFPYDSNGKRGIGAGLGPVQKTRDGEPLGGRVSAADAFGGAPSYPMQPPAAQQGFAPYTPQPTGGYAPPQYPAQPQPGTGVDPITGQPMQLPY